MNRGQDAPHLALGASQLALFILIGPMHVTGGLSGVGAAVVGAIVSYFLSRWAWERKGRPNFWRETVPFWIVSVGAWLVLGLAAKLGLHVATAMHLHHFKRHIVIGGVYFLANCVTFAVRFLIFHYLLFTDRSTTTALIETESLSPVTVPAAQDENEQQ